MKYVLSLVILLIQALELSAAMSADPGALEGPCNSFPRSAEVVRFETARLHDFRSGRQWTMDT